MSADTYASRANTCAILGNAKTGDPAHLETASHIAGAGELLF